MTSREAFEAWFKPTFYDDCAWSESRNCYVEPSVHMAWKGWQAAIQHASDVAVKVCEEIHDDYFRQARGGDNTGKSDARADAADDCADAIKEALK